MDDAERRRRAGQEIKDRRGPLGMTQKDLAKKAGVYVSTVQEIEAGEIVRRNNPRTLSAISEALGWPPSRLRELLYGNEIPAERADAIEADVVALRAEVGDVRRMMDDLIQQFTEVTRRLPADPADE